MKITPFHLERYLAQYEFTAPRLLCCSDCETLALDELLALSPGARERFMKLRLGYTESAGNPELREAIAGLYDTIGPTDVLVHAGAEEAIYNFMQVVLAPGDHVIVHYPCYQSLFEVAKAIGCEVTFWPADQRNGWALDLEFLKAHIRDNTKAVILNCPHNPTGYVMSFSEFHELAALSEKYGFIIFSDEVYRWLEYNAEDRLPAACDASAGAVSLGVMSKSFGLAGLRIGWVATRNRDLLARMTVFKDYTTICASAPSEFLACVAIEAKEFLFQRNLSIIQGNLKLLTEFLDRRRDDFGWTPPQAGPIGFPFLKRSTDVHAFCNGLRETQGVLLLPGTVYGENPLHFRIGFGRKDFADGLRRLDLYLQQAKLF